MKLSVYVIEARGLLAKDLNGFSDPYVKIQLGRCKYRTKVVKKNLNPSWNEEFSFRVEDLKEELNIYVLDEDKYFNDDFIGMVTVPVSMVFDADKKTLASRWFTLQPKNKKSKNKDCGEILLTISLYGKSPSNSVLNYIPTTPKSLDSDSALYSDKPIDPLSDSTSFSPNVSVTSTVEREELLPSKEEKPSVQTFASRLVQFLGTKNTEIPVTSSKDLNISDLPDTLSNNRTSENNSGDQPTFEEALNIIQSKEKMPEMPPNLPGGVVLDQTYVISPKDLNLLLFAPDCEFMKSLAEVQGNTDVQEGSWRMENEALKRVVTCTKPPSRLVKSVKATEDQVYLKADGKTFAILASVSTPDVPMGNCFRAEILFCISPGPELSCGEESSRLVISWRMNFLQSTMMKGVIEGGARQGIKDSYEQYARLLAEKVRVLDSSGSERNQVLDSLQVEEISDWKLAALYFWNFTMVSAVFMGLYVLVHLFLVMPSPIQGLEFGGIDLPDSIGEVIVGGILVLQAQRVLEMLSRFIQATAQRGSDHGIKAQGDGWLLTVALIEGKNLAAVDSTGFSDPYVVFTCNGKTRTSSIKFQTLDPQWNEIFAFDAMEEPPSVMDVEVFDFDGPFDEATSLGHLEINFLKCSITELADTWIPLQGKLALAYQSKLHLRVFLDNTRGTEVVKQYITKIEEAVGKKINIRSPQTNLAFQKLFGLPPEEFLINDFTCHLKRKLPMQGRLFLSPRMIGFHANLFGHKTKFFFLWEDIEDLQVVPPSLATVGSPSLLIILRRGRGSDAKHGAKMLDEEGRLRFHFQSFVSFHAANRTITALWKARSLSPEQKVQIVEANSGPLQTEDSGCVLDLEDAKMSEVYSRSLSVPIDLVMELFEGGPFDRRVMGKAGCLNYSPTPWEFTKPEVYQRQINYEFDKRVSRYGGQVTGTQQKSLLSDRNGWVIDEVMTFHGVPFGDYFNLRLRYQIESPLNTSKTASNVQVLLGIAWLKSTKHQRKITGNIVSRLSDLLKEIFELAEMEILMSKQPDPWPKKEA
ncbi:C2 and GRAM domain-containing protein At1g03370 isoform X2 [Amborella trichopoda]|uniref:C2 and GRAM domain-containing protein n=1 Tax=Amborella trichopoda TaxID=13333 RepID=U5DCP8_AMBTC|nr:C2 and GRAM domain-containing protein At1g03370 isoform X2 [Amborella trichopoda]ERN19192.1 hypothetical protein AMTR_s00061p00181260 [Amborella trichopoda]|eukprot:XP_006857725.1 C2 and GRAM domain-containing protein At1g03370 isoform X2 [Amborella trichopoda]